MRTRIAHDPGAQAEPIAVDVKSETPLTGCGWAHVPLARRGGLFRRCRTVRGRTRGGGLATQFAAFMRRRMASVLAATRATRPLAAAVVRVDGRPSAPLGFLFGHTLLRAAFLDMLGLTVLLVGVFGFVSARRLGLLVRLSLSGQTSDAPREFPGGMILVLIGGNAAAWPRLRAPIIARDKDAWNVEDDRSHALAPRQGDIPAWPQSQAALGASFSAETTPTDTSTRALASCTTILVPGM